MDLIWEETDLSGNYGYLYQVTNDGKTVAKVQNTSIVTCIREQGKREDGKHEIEFTIDTLAPGNPETCEIIGLCIESYNWRHNALNGTGVVGVSLTGQVTMDGSNVFGSSFDRLNVGDVVKFTLDIDAKMLLISIGEKSQEVTLSTSPPYQFACSFRKVGTQITAQCSKKKGAVTRIITNSKQSRIVSSVNVSSGMAIYKYGSSAGSFYAHFPLLGNLYDTFCSFDESPFQKHFHVRANVSSSWKSPLGNRKDISVDGEEKNSEPENPLAQQADLFLTIIKDLQENNSRAELNVVALTGLRYNFVLSVVLFYSH